MRRLTGLFLASFIARCVSMSAFGGTPSETAARAEYKRVLDGIVQQHAKKSLELREAYDKALKGIEQKLTASGDLAGVLSARQEAKRFVEEKSVPDEPPPNTHPEIAALQSRYVKAAGDNNADKNKQILDLAKRFIQYLENLRTTLTRQNQIEAAIAIDKLRGEVLKFPDVAAATMETVQADQDRKETEPAEAEKGQSGVVPVKPGTDTKASAVKKYAGTWKRCSPKFVSFNGKPMQMDLLGCSGAAYDSKRQICVLYGSGAFDNVRNDLWTYDPASDTWTCIQPNDPNADGKTRPKPFFAGGNLSVGFCYDSGQDLYWLLSTHQEPGLWSFDPNTKVWHRTNFSPANTQQREFSGLGYHPGLQSLVSICGPFNPKSGKVSPVVAPPVEVPGGGWQPSSALKSNGLSSPDDKGCYIVFGKSKDNNTATMLFDPANGAWTVLKPTQSPSARSAACVVHHKGLKVWVMYGGRAKDGLCSDTWVYAPHLSTWLEIDTGAGPPPGYGALWYDEAGDQMVLYGEKSRGEDTWLLKLAPAN